MKTSYQFFHPLAPMRGPNDSLCEKLLRQFPTLDGEVMMQWLGNVESGIPRPAAEIPPYHAPAGPNAIVNLHYILRNQLIEPLRWHERLQRLKTRAQENLYGLRAHRDLTSYLRQTEGLSLLGDVERTGDAYRSYHPFLITDATIPPIVMDTWMRKNTTYVKIKPTA